LLELFRTSWKKAFSRPLEIKHFQDLLEESFFKTSSKKAFSRPPGRKLFQDLLEESFFKVVQ